jgi:cytochrome P450
MAEANVRIPDDHARNLVDPVAYADGRVFRTYDWLRSNQPLGRAEVEGVDPFWVVTRHADILEISRQNDLFLNGDKSPTLVSQEADARIRDMMGGSPHLLRTLIHMDAPDHPKYRALTQAWFMPQNLRSLETRIREIARASVDKMAATGGRCDFVREVALHFPLHVVMEILGVPEADEPRMLTLTQELFGAADPELGRAASSDSDSIPTDTTGEGRRMDLVVITDFFNDFNALSADRRASPRNDLASVIANAQIDGRPISELEAMSYYIIVATAGHDTTSASTAGAMMELARNPALFERFRAADVDKAGLIEEAVRWTTPVQHFMRSAVEDTELNGQKIKAGDWMMLCYASGNRDEAVFADPFTFNPDRAPNTQIGFGFGGHVCLGQHLARMEMRILMEELLPRLASVELTGDPARVESVFVGGLKRLPIRFKAA